MDAVDSVVDPLREFAKDSVRLVKRCHKPDRKGTYVTDRPQIPIHPSPGSRSLCVCVGLLLRFARSDLLSCPTQNSPRSRRGRRSASSSWASLASSSSSSSSPSTTSSSAPADLISPGEPGSLIWVQMGAPRGWMRVACNSMPLRSNCTVRI
jgi:hypothetical protein